MNLLLKKLNQRPIAVYPIYLDIAGSSNAGLLLSQLMYWFALKDKFHKTNEEICGEIHISLDQLKSAKNLLKKLDFITISLEGIPAKTYYKIDWEKYEKKLSSFAKAQDSTVGGKSTNKEEESTPTSQSDMQQPVGGKSTNKEEESTPTIYSKIKKTTSKTTSKNLSPLPSLAKKQIDPEREEREENKKSFLNFINDLRKKYKGNSVNSFYPVLTTYENQEIKVASNGYLYFGSTTEYLAPAQAQNVWEYLYKNPSAIIPISKQGAAS